MCLAVPLQIERIEGEFAIAKAGSSKRKINIQMLDRPKPGDYCLVHAGFAINKIDVAAARKTLALLDQMQNARISKR